MTGCGARQPGSAHDPRLFPSFEPFILSLLATVLLATVLPARGEFATFAGISPMRVSCCCFSARCEAVARRHLDRHAQLAAPSGGAGIDLSSISAAGARHDPAAGYRSVAGMGILFLTLLPSTVQSSIAFTAIARGNVAAAICSASFSNLLGIIVTRRWLP